jgi:tRNA nucleotidyltransferase (CCA-adding enzyme)
MVFSTDKELAKFIKSKGGELWQVGGSIRDELLGKTPKDKDYVITGIDVSILPFDKIVGQSFPVFRIKIGNEFCEIAAARKERKEGVGYHGFSFHSSPDVTIEEDLMRRDLTINSIAKNVLTGEIVDPYGGQEHIEEKVLKHTSDAFIEDPLRAIRVARFAVKMSDFKVAEETIQLLQTMRDEVKHLTPERVWKELEEVLKHPKPSTFFIILKKANLLDIWFPEVDALDCPDRHDGTVFNHTMNVIDVGATPLERFGLLCHDFGKPLTPVELWPKHHDHDALGEKPVLAFCNRLKIPTEYKTIGLLCASQHMKAHKIADMKSGTLLQWVLKNKRYIDILMRVTLIDGAYREGVDREESIQEWNGLRDLVDLALQSEKEITGKDLIEAGYDPKDGKKFGDILLQKRIEDLKRKRKE